MTVSFLPAGALLLWLYSRGIFNTNFPPVVSIPSGQLLGTYSLSRNGRLFSEFLGIPYAVPPLEVLRFEPPVPETRWTGIRNAFQYKSECMQIDIITGNLRGSEDCLYLNVFTPKVNTTYINNSITYFALLPFKKWLYLAPKLLLFAIKQYFLQTYKFTSKEWVGMGRDDMGNELLPVMVFIHGGFFMSGGSNMYRPDYFMDHDVVLVTLNYRVASFGFLNTGDNIVRGNMGMKDQVLALKWVQKNIEFFGGDKNRVTIFGQSAGGAAVHYHMLSDLSQGLFQRAISQSGVAFKVFSITPNPDLQAKRFAAKLNCPTDNSINMVDCLKSLSAREITEAHRDYLDVFVDPLAVFAPSIEGVMDDASFIQYHPIYLASIGKGQGIPFMTGVVAAEGLFYTARFIRNTEVRSRIENDWANSAPILLVYEDDVNKTLITPALNQYYFPGVDPQNYISDEFNALTNAFSDRLFFAATDLAVLYHSLHTPLYLYYYNYDGAFRTAALRNLSGTIPPLVEIGLNLAANSVQQNVLGNRRSNEGPCHGDDLAMFFKLRPVSYVSRFHRDYPMSRDLVQLWVDFANDVKPLRFQNMEWPAVNPSDDVPSLLFIDKKSSIVESPFDERVKFWHSWELY